MDQMKIKANAMLAEVQRQRDFAYNRCAVLCADLEVALLEVDTLKKRVDKPTADETKSQAAAP